MFWKSASSFSKPNWRRRSLPDSIRGMNGYLMTVAQSVSHFGGQAIAKLGEARHGRRKSEPPRTGEATQRCTARLGKAPAARVNWQIPPMTSVGADL